MHSFVPEAPKNTSAGTETHQNVPACSRMGTPRHQIVPGAPKNTSAGTETHRNVPACARVGTLRHQIVPGAPEEHQKSTGRAPDKRQELSGSKKKRHAVKRAA